MPKELRALPSADKLLRIVDVQERCTVSRSKAYGMLDEGLEYLRIGGAIRVRESALEAFLNNCTVKD